jgi:4-alpha-glucanotransferase
VHFVQPWTPQLHLALLRRLYEAGSLLTILPIQGFFGWPERINTPATTDGHNWTYRVPVTEALDTVAGVHERMEVIRALIGENGRSMR